MSSFQSRIEAEIPADVHMISGCDDHQTSADVHNISSFQLPDPQGRAGGACTAALLQVLYRGDSPQDQNASWVDVLRQMRRNLAAMGYEQHPQLSSSRMIDVNSPMRIINGHGGTKRAVLIGINYVGQQGQLSGCHNDVRNIAKYLSSMGFQQHNMTILMDDGMHEQPTYRNIMEAFKWIVQESQAGDSVWIHYSGHGGSVRDDDGDEEDGRDETLIPLDFQRAGQIRDDDLLKYLVKPMKKGVLVTCLMDCCHSGTVLDLPYNFYADGRSSQMQRNQGFDMGHLMDIAAFGATFAMASDMARFAASAASGSGAEEILDECCFIL